MKKIKFLNFFLLIFLTINFFIKLYGNDPIDNYPIKTIYPIVFIHGIGGGLEDWKKTIEKVSKQQYSTIQIIDNKVVLNPLKNSPNILFWNASYYTPDVISESLLGDLDLYAERLTRIIQDIKIITHQKKVIIVAHSMGGIIARCYMTLNQNNWDSVYKIVTIGSPNLGVDLSPGIVGQLEDLNSNSKFIKKLNEAWDQFSIKEPYKKWGVVGAVDIQTTDEPILPTTTDSGGIGYIAISSAIPYNEYLEAIQKGFDYPELNTSHFGFRLITKAKHLELLSHPATLQAIEWAIK